MLTEITLTLFSKLLINIYLCFPRTFIFMMDVLRKSSAFTQFHFPDMDILYELSNFPARSVVRCSLIMGCPVRGTTNKLETCSSMAWVLVGMSLENAQHFPLYYISEEKFFIFIHKCLFDQFCRFI